MGKETGWQIIFEGNLFEGQKRSLVKKRIAGLFNMDQPAVDNLFKGGSVILKSDLAYGTALKYQAAFQRTGAKCRIVSLDKPAPAADQTGQFLAPFAGKNKTAQTDRSPLADEIIKKLQVEINHFPLPSQALVNLIFVDLGLALLLLLYLALFVACGYFGCSLALTNLQSTLGSAIGMIAGGIVFLITLFLIATVLFFLIKPLLPHRFKKHAVLELNPFKEQPFFAYIQELCGILRAPMPQRIEVDCKAGLSLRFRNGLAGYLTGEVVLVLGLPLVAGLDLNELTGLLSREFRRFSRGMHMRLTYMARRINHLFKEGSSSADSIDEKFAQWNQREELWLQMAAQICLFLAAAGRKLMGLWRQGCLLISGPLLQQLEFDADYYQTQLIGNLRFGETLLRLNTLDLAVDRTLQNLQQDWKERHLADDLTGLMMFNRERLSAAIVEKLKRDLTRTETTRLSIRPSAKARIASAAARQQPGLVNLDRPAIKIFTDFASLSRQLTLHCYRSQMNWSVTEKNLLPITAVIKHQDHLQQSQTSFKKYLAGSFIDLRPLPLQARPELSDRPIKERIAGLLKAAAQIKKLSVKDKQSLKDFQALDEKVIALTQADALLQADLVIESQSFNLADGTPDVAKRALKKAITDKNGLESQINKVLILLASRLELAFSLSTEPQIRKHMQNAEDSAKESAILFKIYPEFAAAFPLLDLLRSSCAALTALADNLKTNKENEVFMTVFRQKQNECKSRLTDLYGRLKNVPYPSETGETTVSIAEFIMENDPEKIDEQALLMSAQSTAANMLNLHAQLAGRLAAQADAVEKIIERIIRNQSAVKIS